MVSTTLDFAEKYLLKTEIRLVADMPDDANADSDGGYAAGDTHDAALRGYTWGDDYPEAAY